LQSSNRYSPPLVEAAATLLTSERNQSDASNKPAEINEFFNKISPE
jgi:hypothetical protein